MFGLFKRKLIQVDVFGFGNDLERDLERFFNKPSGMSWQEFETGLVKAMSAEIIKEINREKTRIHSENQRHPADS